MNRIPRLDFKHHVVEVFPDTRCVVTTLKADGVQVVAQAQDTREYQERARERGAADGDEGCFQHEVCHVLFGELLDRESPVLSFVARGTELEHEAKWREESIVLEMQAYFNKFGWPQILKGIVS